MDVLNLWLLQQVAEKSQQLQNTNFSKRLVILKHLALKTSASSDNIGIQSIRIYYVVSQIATMMGFVVAEVKIIGIYVFIY